MEVMFDTTVSVMSLAFKTKASAMAAMIMIMMIFAHTVSNTALNSGNIR